MPFLLLLVIPLIEIILFIKIGGIIGVWPTIGIVILTAIAGTYMLRRQGLAALRSVQARLAAGEDPGRLLADGAMILVAGALLLAPGFFTDALGLILLIPPVRGWIYDRLVSRMTMVTVQRRSPARAWPGGETVEGEYEEVDTDAGRHHGGAGGRFPPVGQDRR